MGIFLSATLVVGLIAVPRLIGYVARFKSNEMLIVTVLGLCFGVSLLAVKLGYSVALGAFVIGAVIAEAREIQKIETLMEPVRDMFSAIFFVAIGLLIDPKMLVAYWLPILVITLVVMVGKVVTCSFGAFVGGNDTRTSLRVGMGLAQIGEFSFIIAALGVTLEGDELISLSHCGRGLGDYDADNTVSNQECGRIGGMVRSCRAEAGGAEPCDLHALGRPTRDATARQPGAAAGLEMVRADGAERCIGRRRCSSRPHSSSAARRNGSKVWGWRTSA